MSGASIPGDLALSKGSHTSSLVRVSGPESVRDRLKALFGVGQGAYWADVDAGFPYTTLFALRGDEILAAQALFTEWLRSHDFVSAVERVSVEFDRTERIYYFEYTVRSAYGRVEGTLNFGVS